MNVQTEAARVLRDASSLITAKGLAKGTYIDERGGMCMWGAIGAAAGVDERKSIYAWEGMPTVLGALNDEFPHSITAHAHLPGVAFNDLPGTTATDVAKVLLKVADRVEVS